jgi:hypothetical protein
MKTISATTSPNGTDTTFNDYLWNDPILVDTIVKDDSVELVYRQMAKLQGYPFYEQDRVYKIICSCKDGQWHEERVEGVIVPKSDEHYIF